MKERRSRAGLSQEKSVEVVQQQHCPTALAAAKRAAHGVDQCFVDVVLSLD
jgi:hypothetical protein